MLFHCGLTWLLRRKEKKDHLVSYKQHPELNSMSFDGFMEKQSLEKANSTIIHFDVVNTHSANQK